MSEQHDDWIEKMKRCRLASPSDEVKRRILMTAGTEWQMAQAPEEAHDRAFSLRPLLSAAAVLLALLLGSEWIADLTLARWRIPADAWQAHRTQGQETALSFDELLGPHAALYRSLARYRHAAPALDVRQQYLLQFLQRDGFSVSRPDGWSQALHRTIASTTDGPKGVLS